MTDDQRRLLRRLIWEDEDRLMEEEGKEDLLPNPAPEDDPEFGELWQ